MSGYIFVDTANHTLERLSGSALREVVGTVGNHILHALRPSYRTGELCDEVGLYLSSIGMRFTVHILVDRANRLMEKPR